MGRVKNGRYERSVGARGMKHVRDYVSQGNGPMVVEMSTYRYHGHSMSDPGKVYRDGAEVKAMRENNDPIKNVRQLLLEHTDATEDELNTIERTSGRRSRPRATGP